MSTPARSTRSVPDPVIVARNLGKTYGDVEAVRDLSFTVDRGRIVGLLGPNGSGKTTTVNMLATVAPIDNGSASIGGYDVTRRRDARLDLLRRLQDRGLSISDFQLRRPTLNDVFLTLTGSPITKKDVSA